MAGSKESRDRKEVLGGDSGAGECKELGQDERGGEERGERECWRCRQEG